LRKYSDFELIKWYPSAPYGRKKLLQSFIKYWETSKWFFYGGKFYFGDWSHWQEREEPNWGDLELSELIDILGWLNDQIVLRGNVLTEINWRISEIDPEENGFISRTDVPIEMQNLFIELATVGAIAFGAEQEGRWPNERREPDQELLLAAVNRIRNRLSVFDDQLLEQFPLMDISTVEALELTLKDLKEAEPDWSWVETGAFYLTMLFNNGIAEQNYILTRK
jgi:hypothetical protein